MELSPQLLQLADEAWQLPPELHSCWNARGSYNPLQFVLRLRPDVHAELDSAGDGIRAASSGTFEQAQAFSTYLHETIHWWQHVGSTLGLVLSFLQPAHAHFNRNRLQETLNRVGPVKSLKSFAQQRAFDGKVNAEASGQSITYVLNNWHDLEFFRRLTVDPRRSANAIQSEYFESVGHSYQMAMAITTWLVSSTVDSSLLALPDPRRWEDEFRGLRENKVPGFYWGSPVALPPLGAREIFEGQARFSQIQYLYGASGGNFSWSDFSQLGMVDGVYRIAFDQFLKITGKEWPATPDDPLVGLFLIVCDLSINPTEGFIEDIRVCSEFVEATDPGYRFLRLCREAKKLGVAAFNGVCRYTAQEYWELSDLLSRAIGQTNPREIAEKVVGWGERHEGFKSLTDEDRSFQFLAANLPIRMFLARFLKFQADKLAFPEFFCWPGMLATSHRKEDRDLERALTLMGEHAALFVDKPDGDVYPRFMPGRDNAEVYASFNNFYAWIPTYELTRQWIVADGSFDYDFFWLSSKHTQDEMKRWASNLFRDCYGVEPDAFKTL
jgi:hypothetical protein